MVGIPLLGYIFGAVFAGMLGAFTLEQTNNAPWLAEAQAQEVGASFTAPEVRRFARAYGPVMEVRREYMPRIRQAPADEAQAQRREMQARMRDALHRHGMSVAEFNAIMQTARRNPAFRQQVGQLIEREQAS